MDLNLRCGKEYSPSTVLCQRETKTKLYSRGKKTIKQLVGSLTESLGILLYSICIVFLYVIKIYGWFLHGSVAQNEIVDTLVCIQFSH